MRAEAFETVPAIALSPSSPSGKAGRPLRVLPSLSTDSGSDVSLSPSRSRPTVQRGVGEARLFVCFISSELHATAVIRSTHIHTDTHRHT